jgi:hypothetical protein
MSSEVTVRQQTELSPWGQAVQAANAAMPGSYLFFKKGDWLVREEEVSGKELIANPFEIYYGFQYWRDQTPGDVQMVRIDQLHLRPRREELGDLDQDKWETGLDGQPKDPWTPTVRLILKDPETQELFVFSSSSYGGRGAVNGFCAEYDKDRLRFPGQMPIVCLASEAYQHKRYGKVENPRFKIVGWGTWDGSEAPPEATPAEQIKAELDDVLPDFTI